jgi:hypothetical protein
MAIAALAVIIAPFAAWPNPITVAVLPAMIGYLFARGYRNQALIAAAMFPMAVAMLAITTGGALVGFGAILQQGALAATGLVLGTAIKKGWTYGQAVGAVAGIACAVAILNFAVNWTAWVQTAQQFYTIFETALNRGPLGREMTPEDIETAMSQAELIYITHWPSISVGFASAMLVMAALAAVASANGLVKGFSQGATALRTGFVDSRPPDWMVWVVIVVAGLWFYDDYRPNNVVRMVSWNTAITLAVVYWLYGVATIFYVLRVFKARPIVYGIAAIFVLVFYMMTSLFGLFDTWGDFRRRAEMAKAMRDELKKNDRNNNI